MDRGPLFYTVPLKIRRWKYRAFCLTVGDRNKIHTSTRAAVEHKLTTVIAPGSLVWDCAAATVTTIVPHGFILCGFDEVRFRRKVFPDTALEVSIFGNASGKKFHIVVHASGKLDEVHVEGVAFGTRAR
ncbi:MAG TPA: MaoC family dehydratase [Candidatus Paceibacterota bacterium]